MHFGASYVYFNLAQSVGRMAMRAERSDQHRAHSRQEEKESSRRSSCDGGDADAHGERGSHDFSRSDGDRSGDRGTGCAAAEGLGIGMAAPLLGTTLPTPAPLAHHNGGGESEGVAGRGNPDSDGTSSCRGTSKSS